MLLLLLLESKNITVNVNARNWNGNMSLVNACLNNFTEISFLPINGTADVNIQTFCCYNKSLLGDRFYQRTTNDCCIKETLEDNIT